MTAQVIFICQWLDCPDDKKREHWDIQRKIDLAKAKLAYDIKVLGINEYQAELCFDRWYHANRDGLKIVNPLSENEST
jgi:hypothetical protein